jgi:predicted site-specific integrase-resolvase
MTVNMRGQTYYRTAEVCSIAGISRSTLFRWLRKGVLDDVSHRDRRGWRLFTDQDIWRISEESNRVKEDRVDR